MIRPKLNCPLFCIALVFANIISSRAEAFTLTISNPHYYGAGVAIATQLDALAAQIQTQFNTVIASASNQKSFLGAVSNANADSHTGYIAPGFIPADDRWFVNAGGSFSLGLGQGASLNNGISLPKNEMPPIGVGVQSGVTLGLSGRLLKLPLPLDPSRTMYTLSFSTMDLSKIVGKGVSLKMTQISAGVMYQMFNPTSWTPLFRYNGIQLSGGLTYSKFSASYTTPFNIAQTDGSGDTMTWDSSDSRYP